MNEIVKSYIPTADMIAGMFGPSCEVVVHDLTQPETSVVYVANGNVTGRRIGQSFDHLVRQVLLSQNFSDDKLVNYFFSTEHGQRIKSSSALIRDPAGTVIGMLCINYDVTALTNLNGLLSSFLADSESVPPQAQEVPDNIQAILMDLIGKIIGARDLSSLSRKELIEIIGFMDQKGIFLVKGSIDKVAQQLGVSRVTVYSYLDEARKNNI